MFKSKPASDVFPARFAEAAARASPLSSSTTRGASAPRALFSFVLRGVLLGVLVGAVPALAQAVSAPAMSDPGKVVVIIDDAGDVGIMISNAQLAHEMMIESLRKRLGRDGVAYEGQRKNAATMKRMLGSNAETTIQDTQLAWFDKAMKAAPWRVRVRFGQKKGQHWVTATCRKAGDKVDTKEGAVVDTATGTGKTFVEAKDALGAKLSTFCLALPAPAPTTQLPIEGTSTATPDAVPGLQKKKEPTKTWTPPPRRD